MKPNWSRWGTVACFCTDIADPSLMILLKYVYFTQPYFWFNLWYNADQSSNICAFMMAFKVSTVHHGTRNPCFFFHHLLRTQTFSKSTRKITSSHVLFTHPVTLLGSCSSTVTPLALDSFKSSDWKIIIKRHKWTHSQLNRGLLDHSLQWSRKAECSIISVCAVS